MEKGSARLFQQTASSTSEQNWNVVELDIRKKVRQKVNELLRLAGDMAVTTGEIQQHLLQGATSFGTPFATQLVRSLQRDNYAERQSIVWLLTVLNDKETILPLQQMANDSHLPRSLRLSASLALAGMGITAETIKNNRHTRLYAIS